MIEKFPYRIQKILNDRGQEFQAHFTSTLRRRVSDISISNRTLRDNQEFPQKLGQEACKTNHIY